MTKKSLLRLDISHEVITKVRGQSGVESVLRLTSVCFRLQGTQY